MEIRQARPMTARTLEEIEALAADATPGPWTTKGKSVKALGAPSERTAPNGWQGGICNCMGSGHGPRSRIDALAETNAALIAELPNLLAIAQGQRAEIAKLKRAIIAANRGVIAGEGVGLAYYMENCYGVEDSPAESVEVIHQVTGE